MNFTSDNAAGVSPGIMTALAEANRGAANAYGADAISRRLDGLFSELFEREVAVFPVATGTAANALALACLTPPWGVVYCHREAHVEVDECGALEFYSGARLALLPGAHAKLDADALQAALAAAHKGVEHHSQPAAVTITQATEAGAVWRPDEVARIGAIARAHGLPLHMDGARFANAAAALGRPPAELTWRAGVDVLSFGATKNGAMAAEAVVFFDPARAAELRYRRKRAGHLFSKMRFLSAQLEACLKDDLWLRNARHANACARRLAEGLAALPGARLAHPCEANEVFVELPEPAIARLQQAGVGFHRWSGQVVRLVCAWDTALADVERALALARP
jgi:threonine aldolase